jgi:uncharacterized protein (DUF433 family)
VDGKEERMTEPQDTNVAPGIVTNPARLQGRPTIQGTRISVQLVLDLLEHGRAFDDILASYPHLTREQLGAAVWYARHLVIAQTPGTPAETDEQPRDWEVEGNWVTLSETPR